MPEINEYAVDCPYCGEPITVLIDNSLPEQQYVEDCQVCCRPMVLRVLVDADGDATVTASAENE